MPHDAPDMAGLVIAVREFVGELAERLDAGDRYQALCSVYLLEIVERELRQWQRVRTEDDGRIERLAGLAAGGDSSTALERLCANLREGVFDERLDELLPELLAHVRDKARVSRPDVLTATDRDAAD